MAISEILTHRLNNNWHGVLEEWENLDDVEKSAHIMTDSEEWKVVQGAQLQAETHQKMIDVANAQQTKPYVPNMDGIGAHMVLRFYKDPKNEPGVIAEKIKTFYAKNEQDLRFAIANHAQKCGILQMANIPVKDLEKLQNEESKESA